ncbi:MAG: hypothetical protein JO042_10275 [Sinobacteraceae bacterium]|nr:hypothetical protein [Nevskiaceae bacterium]
MSIALLVTGAPPDQLISRFGRYPDMFARLLGPGFIDDIYEVGRNAYPAGPDAHDAYLITGSAVGVYDDLPWIERLKQFLVSAKGKTKLVGICFGHQVMAEAFGGRVVKSHKGWAIGLQDYAMIGQPSWSDGTQHITVPASHQDQVIELPPRSRVVTSNSFCEIAGLEYLDQRAISFQFHPEFEPAYMAALIGAKPERSKNPAAAIAALERPNDRQRVAQWIRDFLNTP